MESAESIVNVKGKRVAVLFSGGKDSTYAAYLAKKAGHDIGCLVAIHSKNEESYMFHTPSIDKTRIQAEVMGIPLIAEETMGVKEKELDDLRRAVRRAKDEFGVEGVVTGALYSVYQASRVEAICDELGLDCFNPLWQVDEIGYLEELVANKFKIVVVGVFAYPLDASWLMREIDSDFIFDVKQLAEEFQIHPAGEGGEFETFVVNCPLFSRELKVSKGEVSGEGNSFKCEIQVE